MMATYSSATNIHEKHREIIAEARRHIQSRNFTRKNLGIDALLALLSDSGSLNAYHIAQSCALLATHSDPDDVDVEDFALRCVDECERVITQEHMPWVSYARQPWDDLMGAAHAVLRSLRDGENAALAYQRSLRLMEAGGDAEVVLQEEEEEEEDGEDDGQTQGADEDMEDEVVDFDVAPLDDDEEQDENEPPTPPDQLDVYCDLVSDEQFTQDLNLALDNSFDLGVSPSSLPFPSRIAISLSDAPQSTTTTACSSALENRITYPYGRDHLPYGGSTAGEAEASTYFEHDVDAEDADVIQVFVLLLLQYGPECRADMQCLIENYTAEKRIASGDIVGRVMGGLEGLVIRTKPKEMEAVVEAAQIE